MDQLALSRGAHCVLPWRAVWSTERPCKTAQVSLRRETCCLGWHPSAQPHEAGHALPRARPAKLRLVGPLISEVKSLKEIFVYPLVYAVGPPYLWALLP